jgi:hypothetical protein
MRLATFSLWLGCLASTTEAFSSASKPGTFGRVATRASTQSQSSQTLLGVASVETPSVADMEKGVGGRIEDAFQAAKEKGEAAFVTFITAGYPTAQGTSLSLLMFTLV